MFKEATRPGYWIFDFKKELPDLMKKPVVSLLHYGETVEIIFVRGIEGEIFINGKRFEFQDKNVFFIPPISFFWSETLHFPKEYAILNTRKAALIANKKKGRVCPMQKIEKIGVQLFTLRQFLNNEEFIKTSFEKLKKLGYDEVQTAGCKIDYGTFGRLAREAGLTIVGTHDNFAEMCDNTEFSTVPSM